MIRSRPRVLRPDSPLKKKSAPLSTAMVDEFSRKKQSPHEQRHHPRSVAEEDGMSADVVGGATTAWPKVQTATAIYRPYQCRLQAPTGVLQGSLGSLNIYRVRRSGTHPRGMAGAEVSSPARIVTFPRNCRPPRLVRSFQVCYATYRILLYTHERPHGQRTHVGSSRVPWRAGPDTSMVELHRTALTC